MEVHLECLETSLFQIPALLQKACKDYQTFSTQTNSHIFSLCQRAKLNNFWVDQTKYVLQQGQSIKNSFRFDLKSKKEYQLIEEEKLRNQLEVEEGKLSYTESCIRELESNITYKCQLPLEANNLVTSDCSNDMKNMNGNNAKDELFFSGFNSFCPEDKNDDKFRYNNNYVNKTQNKNIVKGNETFQKNRQSDLSCYRNGSNNTRKCPSDKTDKAKSPDGDRTAILEVSQRNQSIASSPITETTTSTNGTTKCVNDIDGYNSIDYTSNEPHCEISDGSASSNQSWFIPHRNHYRIVEEITVTRTATKVSIKNHFVI